MELCALLLNISMRWREAHVPSLRLGANLEQ